MYKILVVDDEDNIRNLVCKYAKMSNLDADEAENGLICINKLKENDYDLVVMDIMMPELDGFSAVKELRKFSKVPVIMLSARNEEYDKLYGFDLGIDDYVTKPFSPKELMMRINAVLKRYHHEEENKNLYTYEDLKIDLLARTVYIEGKVVELTLKEYELLNYLIENPNQALTREQILEKIWGFDFYGDDRTLDTHIKSLRKKIGKYADNIVTLRRVGYRFETR